MLLSRATWRACEIGFPILPGAIVVSPSAQTAARSRTMNSSISAVTRSACCSGGAPTETICGTATGMADSKLFLSKLVLRDLTVKPKAP
jgi:hypothetical protein